MSEWLFIVLDLIVGFGLFVAYFKRLRVFVIALMCDFVLLFYGTLHVCNSGFLLFGLF